jgi:hypothetical protein
MVVFIVANTLANELERTFSEKMAFCNTVKRITKKEKMEI